MYVQSAAAWKTSFNGGCDSSNIVDLSVSMNRNSKFICCIMDNLFHYIKKGEYSYGSWPCRVAYLAHARGREGKRYQLTRCEIVKR